MTEYLFSYGTLQKEIVQLELFGRTLQGSRDILKGYKTVPIEITDKVFLSKGENKEQLTLVHTMNDNDKIEGTALELSKQELFKADEYEPDNYKRTRVKLESGKQAWIYVAITADN
jgi:gamma-glutamylcyclotransferase (GGCT)/AIG2-like uncharacterized protein YtfP